MTQHTVFVCTSCGAKEGKISKGNGKTILTKLQGALAGEADVVVKPIGCLSNCDHGGTVAFTASGKFGWVMGEQSESEEGIAALAHAARAYVKTSDGFLAKIDRAKPVIARVPPFGYEID